MPNMQAPPPFIGGTVPALKPEATREPVLGKDVTDLQTKHICCHVVGLLDTFCSNNNAETWQASKYIANVEFCWSWRQHLDIKRCNDELV